MSRTASRTLAHARPRPIVPHVRARLRAAIGVAMLIASLALPAAVSAHAELDTVTPADNATVQGSPTEVVMTFTQNLDPAKSSIRVVDAGGTVVVQGGTVPSGSPRELDLALASPLGPGVYTIRWISFSSEDDERDSGTTTFTVVAAPSPTPVPSATSAPAESATPAPSIAPASVAPSPSAPPTSPTASTSDAVIPIVVALVVLVGLGLWLARGRARSR